MKRTIISLFVIVAAAFSIGGECGSVPNTSDTIQKEQSEKLLKEATSQVGMPAIKNFRERKILKDILELRDQEGLVTYTYLFSEVTGRFTYLGETIGYGIPYATQFTNPQKIEASGHQIGYAILPQSDPNGLYSPVSAEGTWILMREPKTGKVSPQYIEHRIEVFTFKLDDDDPRLAYGSPPKRAEK